MSLTLKIELLGRPSLERDGRQVAPKGRKAWGLLAYLLCAGAPAGREQLASLLFADADDPLGTLRWNLAELRRSLGLSESMRGDLISLGLPPSSSVDITVLARGTWAEGIGLNGLGRDLLEGMDFPTSPGFEAWLLNERRHFQAAGEAVLREATMSLLGAGEGERAIDMATKLVALDPLAEEYQALLIRCYAAVGDLQSATRQVAACTELFKRELGVEPGEMVMNAARVSAGSATITPVLGAGAARAQLDAGKAAIDAGVLGAGLECLRRAAAEGHALGDLPLKAEALFAMGSALAHSARVPLQEEGAAALHEVMSLCERTGQTPIAAGARREMAWLDFLAGRYSRAEYWLAEGEAIVVDDLAERAAIQSVFGICKNDTAYYEDAIAHFEQSIELAEAVGDEKRMAFSLAWKARTHLLRGNGGEALEAARRSVDLVSSLQWIGFQALAEATLGEAQLLEGDDESAIEVLEHAFGIALMMSDACYECAAERGIALIEQARGNEETAIARFEAARMRLVERPDYFYLETQTLESLCSAAVAAGHPQASRWVADLESMSARIGARELLARAYMHKASLGEKSALDAARALAAEIDNPALHAAVAATRAAIG
jgi:DNA-binding SARP family transcriptional activator